MEVDFPPGTNIANAKLVDTAGLGPGTFTISGQTITYTVAPEVLVPANTELRLQYDNILNPSVPDANLTVRITTKDTAGSVIDSGTSLAYKIRQIGTEDISNKSITREKINPGAVVAVVTQRSSEVISIPPGQDQLVLAVCKAGEVATGGGYMTNTPKVIVTFSSIGEEPRFHGLSMQLIQTHSHTTLPRPLFVFISLLKQITIHSASQNFILPNFIKIYLEVHKTHWDKKEDCQAFKERLGDPLNKLAREQCEQLGDKCKQLK